MALTPYYQQQETIPTFAAEYSYKKLATCDLYVIFQASIYSASNTFFGRRNCGIEPHKYGEILLRLRQAFFQYLFGLIKRAYNH